ncbi:asparagine synthase (glutamine-hydrolyzing) [[Clostridium] colinum]|uniref:asparagine synthase (glutamine-hydrolyzing) n=1 Tax=[Clostridium] colinum TaxID=36835 RepID=UPI002024FEB1|nr:asparagine synthase (glutamine-hydrolyzing) [[Clostridium] colinum]
MCGFTGFTGNLANKEEVIEKMMNKIIHRGPDSSGIHCDENVTLGFRRLSIIGLENGSQPMYNEDGSIVIVFNGEIYNYETIKKELLEKGHIFKSEADTEVLVHLYEEKGMDMLKDIRGMFAFVIYDMNKKELYAVRDFFGIKPFYYSHINGNFIFGSEIKSFLEYPEFKKEVNLVALENYLSFQYSVLEETFFKGVFKLMPGHYLKYKDGNIDITRYFEPMFEPEQMKLQDAIKDVDISLQESIKIHKVSDVEVGSFLSSGVDSSYVAATFKGDKTFTVGFDYDNYNEISYAKDLSEKIGIENFNKTITKEEYWDTISKVQYHMDEPLADPSAIALYFVSNLASKHVKVALSGEGADEFFGGYNIYKEPFDISFITILSKPIRKALANIVKIIPFSFKGKNLFIRASKDVEERFIGNANMFSKEERESILKNPTGKYNPMDITKPLYDKVKHLDDATKMQYIDLNLWLVGDILLKADKMSMANSLEVRVPFLDKEVFKTASKIPSDYRVNKQATKYIFRMASKAYLPETVSIKKKLGFPVPIRVWLKEDKFYNIVKEAFCSEASKKYFNTDKIMSYLDNHKQGKGDFSRKIWTIYMFLVWHKQFFEEA